MHQRVTNWLQKSMFGSGICSPIIPSRLGLLKNQGFSGVNQLMQLFNPHKKPFQEGSVIATVEKKSFKGWQRQLIFQHLESISIPVVRSKPFLEMVKSRQQEQ